MSKQSSFEKINYSLRPAKAVERKMICTTLHKLRTFGYFSEYRYVGFGSTFFQDHALFHKELGINELISIENSEKHERFNFNKPFHCIDLKFGESVDILPQIKWDKKSILWLDYDDIIRPYFFDDINTFFAKAVSGSAFLLTMNSAGGSYGSGTDNEKREQRLISLVGMNRIPLPKVPSNYSNRKIHNTLKTIIENEINTILTTRNGGLEDKDKLAYKPLFNFRYADGAQMMTIGGVIVSEADNEKYEKSNFGELNFVKVDESIFNIEIPSLTLKEIRFLNSQLPTGINEDGEYLDEEIQAINPLIPIDDIKRYSKIYSYFPIYSETVSI
tara:strand:+ start:1836 stop:2825 length:990 start_codon:yes stop_codon:yes gene_type:complete